MQFAVQTLEACLAGVSAWMLKNKLELNPAKTELMVITLPVDISSRLLNGYDLC